MPNRTFHGQIMYELANDNSWPWKREPIYLKDGWYRMITDNKGYGLISYTGTSFYKEGVLEFIAESPERLARVEVELVEKEAEHWLSDPRVASHIEGALTELGIAKEDYENVVKRLEEIGKLN